MVKGNKPMAISGSFGINESSSSETKQLKPISSRMSSSTIIQKMKALESGKTADSVVELINKYE